ncbi:SH3 type 3 domain protein [Emticicia oligotrophica DSM 17448]|uniref:SH3 type 3 domain protein n=1 Tax=Emticicia oligotrophica (strain DSM 17448 / CIP 109782 / MTCC 6937 / GPTSA100-15) TaxID=929562 RepID=A0ABN4AIP3_EMTOG|nr:SH3 domain-containing protein [Emticicia oligotrophica]AFK01923.1 SH3 type 3 domain protein [Emticicia oligotrophica DSM 17448]
MKKLIIIISTITFSCYGQMKSNVFYTPIELSYFKKTSLYILNEKSIMNYVLTNPVVARQVFDKNLEEFQEINSKIKFKKEECRELIINYINTKTNPTYFGVFYNINSNQKLVSIQISENSYFSKLNNDSVYYKCICLNSSLLELPEDFEEIQAEYNLPGGYLLENKEINSQSIIKKIDSIKIENFSKFNIFQFSGKTKRIKSSKSIINSSPNIPNKMYLLKGDEVEILEEQDDWLRIRYYGKKTIEGWIKRSDIE